MQDRKSLPPMTLPLEKVSPAQTGASTGMKLSPFLKVRTRHTGLDLLSPQGERVLATADGTVTAVVHSVKGAGNVVEITHDSGYRTRYAHLGAISVSKGQRVKRVCQYDFYVCKYWTINGLTDMDKLFYTIGEVAAVLGESPSLVRFWSNSFPKYIKPQRNAKGNRLFTAEDIDTFKQIHLLVKQQGLTLDGVTKKLAADRRTVDTRVKALDSLKEIRRQLVEVRKAL